MVNRKKLTAFLLCFALGPFGLFYINKNAAKLQSSIMVLTLTIGFIAFFLYASNHPATQEEIAGLMQGHFTGSLLGLKTIFNILLFAICIEWIVSMVWAIKES